MSAIVDHDVSPGPLTRCQISGSTDLHLIMDLGHQPPCDALLTEAMLGHPETSYPLRLVLCPESGLAQLDYVIDGAIVYAPQYPYRSGISKPLEEYQRAFADGIVRRLGLEPGALCVDIGSNDGTLLTGFKRLGFRTLGVEPTNVAAIARVENGIDTVQAFFTDALAEGLARDYGRAQVITMTNAFGHMAGLGEVMRGLRALLAPRGVFVTESHYLLDVLARDQFDTIYHEHIRTYSLKALVTLFAQYGMEVFAVERAARYGGNLRAYVARRGERTIEPSVPALLQVEVDAGLHRPETWAAFRTRVDANRDRFMEFLWRIRREGATIAGYSSPGRAVPLLHYYGVTKHLLPYIGELPNSLKLGQYLPGKHIPIVHNRRVFDEQPDYVLILAWHYTDAIVARVRAEGLRSRLVVALPEFAILPS